jgi:hypothetical protein
MNDDTQNPEAEAFMAEAVQTYINMIEPGAVAGDWALAIQYNSIDMLDKDIHGYQLEYPKRQPIHRTVGIMRYWVNDMERVTEED